MWIVPSQYHLGLLQSRRAGKALLVCSANSKAGQGQMGSLLTGWLATCWSMATSLTLHSHGRTSLQLIIRPELWQGEGIINLVTFSGWTNHRSNRQPRVPGLESHCPKLSFPSLEPSVERTSSSAEWTEEEQWKQKVKCFYSVKTVSEHTDMGAHTHHFEADGS